FSYFNYATSIEAISPVVHSMCAEYSKDVCAIGSDGNKRVVLYNEKEYECRWNEVSETCQAAHKNIIQERMINVFGRNIDPVFLGFMLAGILIGTAFYWYFYFKKNISKEKPVFKKFILSAIAMAFMAFVPFIINIFSLIPRNNNSPMDLTADTIVIPIWLLITAVGNFLVLNYYIKLEKTKSIIFALAISILSNFYFSLYFVVILLMIVITVLTCPTCIRLN
ncbi:MAG: hypothetical protein HYW50_05260, partial [Candidatus Diapherotrites archaeon]|nr:hypothetical protein [Candidatus Diapherotrites archaeon]